MTPEKRRRRHLLLRIVFFVVGILLFYAPFALLVRLLVHLTGSPLQADAHRICLRMPFEWALQPWMYGAFADHPLFLIGPLLLPFTALFLGPLFCGWLCPAGAFPELLGKLVPRRLKLDLNGRINPSPIRYGMLIGMMLSPFLGGYVCCSFCNFTMMQNLSSALFGDPSGLSAWASFTIVTFVVWLFVLGVFMNGGRGFCNFLCPAGAVQGLAHAAGSRLGLSRRVVVDETRCRGCNECVAACPALAIDIDRQVNPHSCTICGDCIHQCPGEAIRWRR